MQFCSKISSLPAQGINERVVGNGSTMVISRSESAEYNKRGRWDMHFARKTNGNRIFYLTAPKSEHAENVASTSKNRMKVPGLGSVMLSM